MTKKEILKQAEEFNVHYIRLMFTDIMGVLKNVEISRVCSDSRSRYVFAA